MSNPCTNRKRIRGWQKMLRKLKQLEDHHLEIDIHRLKYFGYCTYQLHISPFSNLTPRNPPGWYFREFMESMIRVSENWKRELEKEDQDYYLAIWLFSPREFKSQLVAAVGARANYYRTLFKEMNEECAFPESIQKWKNAFSWKPHWDFELYSKDADELEAEDISYLKKMSAIQQKAGDEIYYLVPQGTVWVNEEILL